MNKIDLTTYDLSAGLYLIATPIGNERDISIRSLEYLNSVDIIACEDTREFKKLAKTWGLVAKKLITYHMHNEATSTKGILELIQKGQSIALVSDAGTINISDPGHHIVRACLQNNIHLESLPGASALACALSLSPAEPPYVFHAFIAKKATERLKTLNTTLDGKSHVFFESAHRINEHIIQAKDLFPNREVVLLKDLTKKFQQIAYGSLHDLSQNLQLIDGKGEFVLIYLPQQDDKTKDIILDKFIPVALRAGMKNKEILEWLKDISTESRKSIYERIELVKTTCKK